MRILLLLQNNMRGTQKYLYSTTIAYQAAMKIFVQNLTHLVIIGQLIGDEAC